MGGVDPSHPPPSKPDNIIKAFWTRIPWLLIGLIGGFLTGGLAGYFEASLKEEIMIALFLPLVLYMSDAIGTQTEAVLVRALASGQTSLRNLLRQEGAIGGLIGITLGTTGGLGLLFWGGSSIISPGFSVNPGPYIDCGHPHGLSSPLVFLQIRRGSGSSQRAYCDGSSRYSDSGHVFKQCHSHALTRLKEEGIRLKETGPKIHIAQPKANTPTRSPLEIMIRFSPGKAPIDLSTFKVTLVKWVNIDITEHLEKYVTPEGVHIEKVDLPPGDHTVRLTLADREGHVTVKEVNLIVV